jgi:hypothetical protein
MVGDPDRLNAGFDLIVSLTRRKKVSTQLDDLVRENMAPRRTAVRQISALR